jgi:hypothetical protein
MMPAYFVLAAHASHPGSEIDMKTESWDFYQDLQGLWRWLGVLHAGIRRSRTGFGSRSDCIADAMRHGYLTMPTGEPQRHKRRALAGPSKRHRARKAARQSALTL